MKNKNIKIAEHGKEKTEDSVAIFSYQQDAIERLKTLDEKYQSYYSTLVVIPTGGGKTRVAVEYLYKYAIKPKHKVLWIAERLLLLEQAYKTFEKLADREHLPDKAEGEVITRLISSKHTKYDTADIHKHVDLLIITQQTLEKKIDRKSKLVEAMEEWLTEAEGLTIVIDEAHHATAKAYKAILMSLIKLKNDGVYPSCHIIGLTATPKREGANEIEEIFSFGVREDKDGKLEATSQTSYAYQISIHELVKREVLSIPYMAQLESKEGKSNRDEIIVQTYRRGVADLRFYDGRTGDTLEKGAEDFGQTIVFAESRDHALKLEKLFLDHGVSCGLAISIDQKFIDSFNDKTLGKPIDFANKKKQIRENICQYAKGNLALIITVDMLREGVDFPKTQTVFLTSCVSEFSGSFPNKSVNDVEVTQMVGRALRGKYLDGTPCAYIISFQEDSLNKILWESPDSYSAGRSKCELAISKLKFSKVTQYELTPLLLLNESNFQKGVLSDEEGRLIWCMNDAPMQSKTDEGKKLLESTLNNEVVSGCKPASILPKGYYQLGKVVLLVWDVMDLFIEAVKEIAASLVESYNISEDMLQDFQIFSSTAKNILVDKFKNLELPSEIKVIFSTTLQRRYLWHLIRFYFIQCGKDRELFSKEVQFTKFSHLKQYDLSDILWKSVSAQIDEENMEAFIGQIWDKGNEEFHATWNDRGTLQRFLEPKLRRLHQLPLETEEEDGLDEESDFRVRLYRAGRKRAELCDMLKRILEYAGDCDTFVDVFGGTGVVLAHLKGVFENRVYNDYDINLANFVYCVSDKDIGRHFPEYCYDQLFQLHSGKMGDTLEGKMEIMRALVKEGLGDEDIEKALTQAEKRIAVQKNNLDQYANTKKQNGIEYYNSEVEKYKEDAGSFDRTKLKKLQSQRNYYLSRYKELTRQLAALKNPDVERQIKQYIAYYYIVTKKVRDWAEKTGLEKRNEFNARLLPCDEMKKRAFEFMFSRGFPSYRVAKESVTGVNATGIRQFKEHLDIHKKSWLSEYHEKMEHVEVLCKDFLEILEQYGSDPKAVFCLDPPYFLTCQYNMGFPDEYHLKMLDWLRSTPSKWVFCCKGEGTNMIEARNWHSRLNDSRKLIFVENLECESEKPSLDEYFKGFLYPMKEGTGLPHSIKKVKDAKIYYADIRAEVKRAGQLFVYYLEQEKFHEIMVSNIEVPKADVKVLKDHGIMVADFETYFHFGEKLQIK